MKRSICIVCYFFKVKKSPKLTVSRFFQSFSSDKLHRDSFGFFIALF